MPPQPPHITPPPPPPPSAPPPTERTAAGQLLRIGLVVGGLAVLFAVAGGGAAWFLLAAPTDGGPLPLPAEAEPEPAVAAAEPAAAADTGGPDDAVADAAEGEDEDPDANPADDLDEEPEEGSAEGADPDPEEGTDEAAAPDDGAPPAPGAEAAAPKPPPSCDVRAVSKRKDGAAVVKKSTLERYVRNPDSVSSLGSFSWKRHKKSKEIRGVRMRRMPCPGLMRAAGLRNGDVVLSVNGTPATSVARGMVIWADVKASGKARMKVKHGKEGTRTVTVYVRD